MARKIYLFKRVVFNCKRATFLSLKKEEGRISLVERLELSWHLVHCDPCKQFVKQSAHLKDAGKQLTRALETRPPFQLSPDVGMRIQDLLDRADR